MTAATSINRIESSEIAEKVNTAFEPSNLLKTIISRKNQTQKQPDQPQLQPRQAPLPDPYNRPMAASPPDRLQGDDLIAEVLRNMEEGLFRIREKTLVPAIFRIYLNPEDYDPFRNVAAFVAGEIRAALDAQLSSWNDTGRKLPLRLKKKTSEYVRIADSWTVDIYPDLDGKLQRGEIEVYSELGAPQKTEYGAGSLTRRIFPKAAQVAKQTATDNTARTSLAQEANAQEEESTKALCFAYLRYADERGQQVFEVTKSQVVIGRGGRSYWVDVKLETLPDVSREHCRIRRDPETGRFTIEDVSQFGTTLNGKPVGRNASAELPKRATIGLAGVIDLQWESV